MKYEDEKAQKLYEDLLEVLMEIVDYTELTTFELVCGELTFKIKAEIAE